MIKGQERIERIIKQIEAWVWVNKMKGEVRYDAKWNRMYYGTVDLGAPKGSLKRFKELYL